MREEKKLQKKINQEFETPEIPFDEWAAQMGIEFEAPQTAECPVLEPAENVSGRGISNGKKRKLLFICLPAFALLVALAIILGCVLPKLLPAFKVYGENDAAKQEIELQEITAQEDIYLFDMSGVVQMDEVNQYVLKEDESFLLLYSVQNCLLSVKNGDSFDGFYVTYKIKLYAHYEFMGSDYFSELDSSTIVQDKKIDYRIRDFNQSTAYAKFTVGKYEYFIEARGFQSVTVLNEENFLNLLNEILI